MLESSERWNDLFVLISLIVAYAVSNYLHFTGWLIGGVQYASDDTLDFLLLWAFSTSVFLSFSLLILHWWIMFEYRKSVLQKFTNYLVLLVVPLLYGVISEVSVFHLDRVEPEYFSDELAKLFELFFTPYCLLNALAFCWYFLQDVIFKTLKNMKMKREILGFRILVIIILISLFVLHINVNEKWWLWIVIAANIIFTSILVYYTVSQARNYMVRKN